MMSVGSVGFGALDAGVSISGGVAAEADRAHAAALLREAQDQLDAAQRAVEGTGVKLAKYETLRQGVASDHEHAKAEFERLYDLVRERSATLEGMN